MSPHLSWQNNMKIFTKQVGAMKLER